MAPVLSPERCFSLVRELLEFPLSRKCAQRCKLPRRGSAGSFLNIRIGRSGGLLRTTVPAWREWNTDTMNDRLRKPGIERLERFSEEGLERLERQLDHGSHISDRVLAQWIRRYGESARAIIRRHGRYHPGLEAGT